MTENYKILWEGGSGELVEKKSRFIARTCPAKSEEEALAFIEAMRKEYWDARHHCFAYVLGERNQIQRCSDDGEPSQTAGRPILDVILGEEVHNICLVVIRYFGGTLLGTGGLVRAYSGAAKEGLKGSAIVEKALGIQMTITADYTRVGKLQYLLSQNQIPVLDSQYTDKVVITALSPMACAKHLKSQLIEAAGGQLTLEETPPLYYGIVDGEIILF